MTSPIILWFRRDLRLEDHAALTEACVSGQPVIPLFIHDETVEALGAAPKFRLGLSIEALSRDLSAKGSRLILRRGKASDVLNKLIDETNAKSVYWSRSYDPAAIERDKPIKAALKEAGVEGKSFTGHVMFEPWTVETKTGGFYKVYTPLWNAVRSREVPEVLPVPPRLPAPPAWPASDTLGDWGMEKAMKRGAEILRPHCTVGQCAARDRLDHFIETRVTSYVRNRDIPAVKGTSGLSENLAWGEISPATCWHAGRRALEQGAADAEVFLKELVWREFAYHLVYHTPQIISDNWRPEWNGFPWDEGETDNVRAWKQGRTGIQFVDAAMREMYVTGTMHNRGRMIVASYLTKHLLSHWKIGLDWFADCLIDWDPASNAMGWQWSSGSGPDATPYFRVFNPVTQLDKFDPKRMYISKWIAEGRKEPSETARSYFDAVPVSWGLTADDRYPDPIVPADQGRKIALEAYENHKNKS